MPANVLRAEGLEKLVLTGVGTNVVVEATARTGADSSDRIVVTNSPTPDHRSALA
jgi:hypothetical protein